MSGPHRGLSQERKMSLILGSVLTGAAYLAVLFSILAFRNPQGPRWLKNDLVGDIWVVAVLGVGVLGIGNLLKFGLTFAEAGAGVTGWLVAATMLLVCVAATKALNLKKRLAEFAAMAEPLAAAAPSWGGTPANLAAAAPRPSDAANDPVPGKPRPSGQSGGGRRRKAA